VDRKGLSWADVQARSGHAPEKGVVGYSVVKRVRPRISLAADSGELPSRASLVVSNSADGCADTLMIVDWPKSKRMRIQRY